MLHVNNNYSRKWKNFISWNIIFQVQKYHQVIGKLFNLPREIKMKNRRNVETYQGYADEILEK